MAAGKRIETVKLNKVLPRIEASAECGLTSEQAGERLENGYGNESPESPEKTVGQIIRDNLFTYFNLIFFILTICIVAVGSYNNLTFVPVVVANILIGIVQELRSKKTLSKLTFIASPKAVVVRNGAQETIPADKAVLDDIVIFSAGNQIYADAVVLCGECQVNEALVTGESDEITKKAGDQLLSGSFIVSGECRARLEKVGRNSFVSQLTLETKKSGKKRQSEMMSALTRLVKIIGIAIIPFGVILFIQQTHLLGRSVTDGMVSTVAALIGMIPEGLYLLVSVALTVSVIRLAQKKTLVHELGCIETLARVDVLCVDKTGTITENKMAVTEIHPLCAGRFNTDDIRMIMTDYAGSMAADNETMVALKSYFSGNPGQYAVKTLPFSSATKYSGASFAKDETYLLGAPEKILLENYDECRQDIEVYSSQGCRVLLLALYEGDIGQKGITAPVMPLALIVLKNSIRPEAPETFRFFEEQGVSVRVISGDNPLTVSKVAMEAGIKGAERYIDASTLTTERKIKRAVEDYVVFGRVTPDQKRKLVRALRASGHTVAMTGDGVNDVLALKDADCSIAMASGSDVACQVSQIVLMESNFAAMPSVVMEGRRVINNIERSASLFLVKNIFSFVLTLTALIITLAYPITPSQLSLVNIMLIGIPSFVLAMEPNTSLVKGKFLRNVIFNALPAGLTDFAAVLAAILLSPYLGIPQNELSTMSTILLAAVGFMMLYKVSVPFNMVRKVLFIAMMAGFTLGGLLFHDLFTLAPLSPRSAAYTAAFILASFLLMLILTFIVNKLSGIRKRPRHGSRRPGKVKTQV